MEKTGTLFCSVALHWLVSFLFSQVVQGTTSFLKVAAANGAQTQTYAPSKTLREASQPLCKEPH